MADIIGLDLGNVNISTSFIEGMDKDSRRGGEAMNLANRECQEGIPSTFFYTDRTGVYLCQNAVSTSAHPLENRINLLKRHLNEKFTCKCAGNSERTKTFEYNDALKQVVEYALRTSIETMEQNYQKKTNLVSLAYPADFRSPEKELLKNIVEEATLEDGSKFKVVGMISEPAAAALDYLAKHNEEEKTVLVYDLGGGTLDIAIVTGFPEGKKYKSEDKTYYYDAHTYNGVKIGGADFDAVLCDIIAEKLKAIRPFNDKQKSQLYRIVETMKRELSTMDKVEPNLMQIGVFDYITVTRREFEERSKFLLDRTIEKVKETMEDKNLPSNIKPDMILLTGGASQMPMVRQALEKAFPKYKDRIISYKPHLAISHGAARFGTKEVDVDVDVNNNSENSNNSSPIVLRTAFDYGVVCYKNDTDDTKIVSIHIPAGTPLPYEGKYLSYFTRDEGQTGVGIRLMEANKKNPRTEGDLSDFTELIGESYDFGGPVPQRTEIQEKMCIDNNGIMHYYVRDPDIPNKPDKEIKLHIKGIEQG